MRSAVRALTLFLALTAAAPISVPRDPVRSAEGPLTFNALAFPTSSDGWVVASRGFAGIEVLATRDAGVSWTIQWAGPLVPEQIVATDPDHAWVLGQRCAADTCGAELIGTSDGGARWSMLASLPIHISQVAFESPSVGIAATRAAACRDRATGPSACAGGLLLTADAGRQWQLGMKSTEPIVAVATGAGRMWALDAAPGSYKPVWRPPSLVAFASSDGGRAWKARGAVHPDLIAGLDVEAQLVPGRGGRLRLGALDPDSCAMHGCGLDGAWSSPDGGRRWLSLSLPDPFERGVGMPCGYTHPTIAEPMVAVAFDLQDCAGPAAALYRLDGSRALITHIWRSFVPIALAWPTRSVGYALGRHALQRSTDGGRRWRVVSFGS